jgi:hypothetical protein
VPVICSNINAFQQSGQGVCVYLDPLDSLSWQKEVVNIHQDKSYANKLISKYSVFNMPSWTNHFDKLELDLKSVMNIKYNSGVYRPKTKRELKELFLKNNSSSSRYKALKEIYKERSDGMLVVKGKSSSVNRKLNKLKSDPVSFFKDSKFILFRYIGKKLEQA